MLDDAMPAFSASARRVLAHHFPSAFELTLRLRRAGLTTMTNFSSAIARHGKRSQARGLRSLSEKKLVHFA